MKLPISYEHIPYEGDFFSDADGEDVSAKELVDEVNGAVERDAVLEEAAKLCENLRADQPELVSSIGVRLKCAEVIRAAMRSR